MSSAQDYRAVVRATVSAVEIRSATTFTWFGCPSPDVAPAVKQAVSPATARAYLAYVLRAQLYEDMYCRGTPTPSLLESLPKLADPHPPLAEALSAVNSGRAYHEPGWVVTELASAGGLVVQSEDLELNIQAGDCIPAEDGKPIEPGSKVSVRLPCEMLGISPGFYMARGEAPVADDPDARLIRYYWNITPSAAVPLIALLTGQLNRSGIPFKLKVVNDPSAFTRCDAGVLYVAPDDYAAVTDIVRRTLSVLQRQMRYTTPAFTKRLAPGLGLAEDPGGRAGFGLHRCGIVGEGLIRAYEQGLQSRDDRLAVVLDTFEESGITIDAPYLNPGSIDDYDVLPSQGPSTDSAYFVRWLVANAASGAPSRLDVAVQIGRRLCADAIWSADRCAWVGPSPNCDTTGPSRGVAYASIGPDLYSGAAGVGWFLGELHAVTGIDEFRKTGRAALSHAIDGVATLPPECLGFFTGRIGVAYVAARVGRLEGDERLLSIAARLVGDRLAGGTVAVDLLSGAAGAILGLLAVSRLLDKSGPVDSAVQLGDRLLGSARSAGAGCSWRLRDVRSYRDLTGYSRGAAGIAHALLELFAITGDSRYRDCAERAFAYERASFDDEDRNWYDYRLPPGVRSRRDWTPRSEAHWCHGAPGVALSRLAAVAILTDGNVRAEAQTALDITRRSVEGCLAAGTGDYSLCHGLTGNAEILAEGARVLGQASDLADVVADQGTLDHAGTAPSPWPCGAGGAPFPGLMLGLAGVGHFYLRRSGARVPSPVLLAPVQLAPDDSSC